ncbi:MAG: type II toxin-antitoxin system HicA family toxin [Candidatus Pacebacteria bacterium]|nr:type II toxin-antitoxin system HicA family toxin [Candidatus Paceibacterota bacterium]
MPKLRVLSGEDLVKAFEKFDFVIVGQKGSHVKLQRYSSEEKQTLTIPLHKVLDRGITKAIYNQSLKYLSEKDLKPLFYTS